MPANLSSGVLVPGGQGHSVSVHVTPAPQIGTRKILSLVIHPYASVVFMLKLF